MFASDPDLHVGTSSWSSKDWLGVFYPPKTPPEAFIEYYASKYDTVEIDATFYRMPTARQVDAWTRHTPEEFTFAVKTPRVITHEKTLVDAEDDMLFFLETIAGLGKRLGPILLQFPYFNKQAFADKRIFFDRLNEFLNRLPKDKPIAVEVRNKAFVGPALLEVCQSNGAALAWVFQAWMPGADAWLKLLPRLTVDFAYLRLLGDHKAIEELAVTWDKLVIDRTDVLREWAGLTASLREAQIKVFGYFNNHFVGHAPGSVEQFRNLYPRVFLQK